MSLPPDDAAPDDTEQQAAAAFIAARSGGRPAAEEPLLPEAIERVSETWELIGRYAAAPEMITRRERALTRARQAATRRWKLPPARARWALVLSIALVAAGGAGIWRAMDPPPQSRVLVTERGERRLESLEDGSRVTLDSATQLRVAAAGDTRTVALDVGQAQFEVAHDPRRPFRVEAGGYVIVALGTTFNVEFIDGDLDVALLEGRIRVRPRYTSEGTAHLLRREIDLRTGQTLRIRDDGQAASIVDADIDAVTAWHRGEIVLRAEPLALAVRRMNRYSHTQLELANAQLGTLEVSGVFAADDAEAFAAALERILPVAAAPAGPQRISLTPAQ